VGSFLSAINEFTCVRIEGSAANRVDRLALVWLPVIGFLAALIAVSFYFPLAALYVPLEIAILPGLLGVSWLRAFKPETDFCQLCDILFGFRKRYSSRSIVAAPAVCCLLASFLLRYAILRQFFLADSVRLLALGTFVSFVAPMLLPASDHRWIQALGYFWVGVGLIAALGPLKGTSLRDVLISLRGPSIAFVVILVTVHATSALLPREKPASGASLVTELAAYVSFLVVRYHFL
jgi:hypothetical protein